MHKNIFSQILLFSAIVAVARCDDFPITHTNTVAIPDVLRPGYLESYVDQSRMTDV